MGEGGFKPIGFLFIGLKLAVDAIWVLVLLEQKLIHGMEEVILKAVSKTRAMVGRNRVESVASS